MNRIFNDYPIKDLITDSRTYLFAIAFLLSVARIIAGGRVLIDEDSFIEMLSLGSILFLLWKKRNTLKFDSSLFASGLGLVLIFLMVFKGLSIFWFEPYFIRIATLGSAIGLCLLASGFKGIKQYAAELVIVISLCIPTSMIFARTLQVVDVPLLTAKVSNLILWYLGFQSSRQGVNIYLPNGGVEVIVFCTGLSSAVVLLRLSIICMAVFIKSWFSRFVIGVSSIFIGFILGCVRVVLMALVVSDRPAFDFWHGSSGNQIFSTIGILAFGLLANYLITKPDEPRLEES
jgi:cyanoexosortase A